MNEKKIVANRLLITYRNGDVIEDTTIVRCSQGYVVVKEPDWLFLNKQQLIDYFSAILADFDSNREMEVL